MQHIYFIIINIFNSVSKLNLTTSYHNWTGNFWKYYRINVYFQFVDKESSFHGLVVKLYIFSFQVIPPLFVLNWNTLLLIPSIPFLIFQVLESIFRFLFFFLDPFLNILHKLFWSYFHVLLASCLFLFSDRRFLSALTWFLLHDLI